MIRNLYITHRIFKTDNIIKKGGSDYIFDYFKNKSSFIIIESNLNDFSNIKEDIIKISLFHKSKLREIYNHKSKNFGFFFKFLKEFFIINFFLFFKVKKINFAIVVNPINGTYTFLASLSKKINFKYFHIVDYSKNRFQNKLLNYIYFNLFKLSIFSSDKVGVVSKKIENLFKSKEKLFHIPNSPSFRRYKSIKLENKKYDFIFCIAEINESINFDLIIKSISLLKQKLDVKCLITGNFNNTEYELSTLEKIKKYKLDNNFNFIGFQNLDSLDFYLNYSKIGIVSYIKSNLLDYYQYADSLKIREYAYFGLPILSDKTFPTSSEAASHNACLIFDDSVSFYELSFKLLTDSNYYKKISSNSKQWANKNDKISKLKILESFIPAN